MFWFLFVFFFRGMFCLNVMEVGAHIAHCQIKKAIILEIGYEAVILKIF